VELNKPEALNGKEPTPTKEPVPEETTGINFIIPYAFDFLQK